MKIKRIILLAVSLIVFGISLLIAAIIIDHTSILNIDGKLVPKTYEITETFENINMNLKEANVKIYLSDSINKVECLEKEHIYFEIDVVDNTLSITEVNEKKFTFINLKNPIIHLYLTEELYNSLNINTSTSDIILSKSVNYNSLIINGSTADIEVFCDIYEDADIKVTTGDILIENSNLKNANINVSTGDIEINNTTIDGNLICKATTGDIELSSVVTKQDMKLELSTGDVELDEVDAANIYVKSKTGDVKGTILSGKVFKIKTSTGKVIVPDDELGGKCEITTSTGDIILRYKK